MQEYISTLHYPRGADDATTASTGWSRLTLYFTVQILAPSPSENISLQLSHSWQFNVHVFGSSKLKSCCSVTAAHRSADTVGCWMDVFRSWIFPFLITGIIVRYVQSVLPSHASDCEMDKCDSYH